MSINEVKMKQVTKLISVFLTKKRQTGKRIVGRDICVRGFNEMEMCALNIL